MEVHVAVDVTDEVVRLGNRIESGERSGGSVYVVDGDRSVQSDQRAGLALQEHVVEAQDCLASRWPRTWVAVACKAAIAAWN